MSLLEIVVYLTTRAMSNIWKVSHWLFFPFWNLVTKTWSKFPVNNFNGENVLLDSAVEIESSTKVLENYSQRLFD